jgi:WD40 repeat protein
LSAADADFVLKDRGSSQALEEFVVGVAFMRGGIAAFALGDGTLRLATAAGAWTTVAAHDGGVLAMAGAGDAVVTGGDDGRFCRTGADGAVQEMAKFGSKWVEQVAAWSDGKAALLACGVGKTVHLFDGAGQKLKELPHPATVAGIAFDAKGKRVAAAHYGGATLWFVGAKVDSPRLLEWKGSHIGIAIHPGGDAVVTAMQENALHGWRLADGQHMRMSGYPAKTESMSFSRNGKWLATSGAESIVMWPFFGGGPMGKAPTELAGGDDVQCTRVAFHPQSELVAAGFSDGLVVVADVPSQRILPMAAPGRGPVSALAWSPDGTRLAFGTERGFAALVDLSKR